MMDPDENLAPDLTGVPRPAEAASVAELNYAPVMKHRSMRRWLARHPAWCVLGAIVVAIGLGWEGWKWRLKEDEKAFHVVATISRGGREVDFTRPPTAAALRHLERMPGPLYVGFFWNGDPDPSATIRLRGRRFPQVAFMGFSDGLNVDAWLKELARPDSGLTSLVTLNLPTSSVTDAGLKELARPDSGLKSLVRIDLAGTRVTDAGLKELARPDSGLKSLAELNLMDTDVTNAGLKEIARPDSGLKALATLSLQKTYVTDAGLKELARPDSGLKVLATVVVGFTRVTAAAIVEVRRARPGLKIDR